MSRAKDIAKKNSLRLKRKRRVRGSINAGTAEMPRVTVFRSNKYLTAQAINDTTGTTLASVNSKTMNLSSNKANAAAIAAEFANNLKSANIETIVFDRNGYLYHGVVAAFVDALRDNGIKV
ncbi:MAG: 50S ribosomal protein L18 [Campylobacteraceae bacterium]|jgi:large subunit ribosomal protein L18|nr:50S ribosomal protein L18 [Campylobacteraceae bacterium]MBT3881685.1 50S ribosomal protein L18 [Campylobacteraceae bacterium]MBT4030981.1 50S ribosomal protein L18 [Campylobacteraceae bacterium]MBT4178657.1 50S ribosomal protein L18 [Campylobacteraceae bacterium]MBT4571747.1 50S ribosomal protein L18 [Campylobacteraceae bacterium]